MTDSFIEQLKTDKAHFSAWFIVLITGFICGLILIISDFERNIQLILIGLFVSLVLIGVILSQVKTTILLDYDNLIIDHSLFGKHFIRTYSIQLIRNLKYERNVKSDSYTTNGNVRVMGIDVTPESWKDYYYHKEILSFDYKGTRIEIGKWKNEFNGKRLFELLKEKVI